MRALWRNRQGEKVRIAWDGSKVGPNHRCRFFEKQELPTMATFMSIVLYFLTMGWAGKMACVKYDFKSAFKRIPILQSERRYMGFLMEKDGKKIYCRYLCCPFGWTK